MTDTPTAALADLAVAAVDALRAALAAVRRIHDQVVPLIDTPTVDETPLADARAAQCDAETVSRVNILADRWRDRPDRHDAYEELTDAIFDATHGPGLDVCIDDEPCPICAAAVGEDDTPLADRQAPADAPEPACGAECAEGHVYAGRCAQAAALRCICGSPVQWMGHLPDESRWMDLPDGSGWVHAPGSDTSCLNARPRCPRCSMPHTLTGLPAAFCKALQARIAVDDAFTDARTTPDNPVASEGPPCSEIVGCDGQCCARESGRRLVEYPHPDGDVIRLGPEVFASSDGAAVCWKGENYVRYDEPNSQAASDDDLRERYAAAIWERQNPGSRWADCEYRWRADAEADADAVMAVRDRRMEQLAAELAALRKVARGYCPACGRGDAAPTVADWEQQRLRAERAEDAVTRALETLNRSGARWDERVYQARGILAGLTGRDEPGPAS
jgi:hypothetical protein